MIIILYFKINYLQITIYSHLHFNITFLFLHFIQVFLLYFHNRLIFLILSQALIIDLHLFGIRQLLRIMKVPVRLVYSHQNAAYGQSIVDVYHCILD